jgi:hypothetical protein
MLWNDIRHSEDEKVRLEHFQRMEQQRSEDDQYREKEVSRLKSIDAAFAMDQDRELKRAHALDGLLHSSSLSETARRTIGLFSGSALALPSAEERELGLRERARQRDALFEAAWAQWAERGSGGSGGGSGGGGGGDSRMGSSDMGSSDSLSALRSPSGRLRGSMSHGKLCMSMSSVCGSEGGGSAGVGLGLGELVRPADSARLKLPMTIVGRGNGKAGSKIGNKAGSGVGVGVGGSRRSIAPLACFADETGQEQDGGMMDLCDTTTYATATTAATDTTVPMDVSMDIVEEGIHSSASVSVIGSGSGGIVGSGSGSGVDGTAGAAVSAEGGQRVGLRIHRHRLSSGSGSGSTNGGGSGNGSTNTSGGGIVGVGGSDRFIVVVEHLLASGASLCRVFTPRHVATASTTASTATANGTYDAAGSTTTASATATTAVSAPHGAVCVSGSSGGEVRYSLTTDNTNAFFTLRKKQIKSGGNVHRALQLDGSAHNATTAISPSRATSPSFSLATSISPGDVPLTRVIYDVLHSDHELCPCAGGIDMYPYVVALGCCAGDTGTTSDDSKTYFSLQPYIRRVEGSRKKLPGIGVSGRERDELLFNVLVTEGPSVGNEAYTAENSGGSFGSFGPSAVATHPTDPSETPAAGNPRYFGLAGASFELFAGAGCLVSTNFAQVNMAAVLDSQDTTGLSGVSSHSYSQHWAIVGQRSELTVSLCGEVFTLECGGN